jgi:2-(1,2-epoxy-1,2-dihydrophenyl)acetyl-CoA isomerase
MSLSETVPGEPVLLRREGAVAVLQLNRPAAHNALDVPTARAVLAACEHLKAAGDVRAVILCGAGRSFGVGGDLSAMREGAAGVAAQLIDSLHAAVQILAALDAPVLASLQGAVAGGSMSLALAADLAIAADDASFNLAYTRIGASCDLSSSWHLPRLVGLRRSMEIALLSEPIDAAEALRLGLVNRVVARARLEEETMALARRLADGPTLAYGRLKRLLRRSFESELAGQLDAEREAFCASTGTGDFEEGVAAFFARRKPAFQGR